MGIKKTGKENEWRFLKVNNGAISSNPKSVHI